MKDYQKRLDSFTDFSDKKMIKQYLEKYWLDKKELSEYWSTIKNIIYNPNFKVLPDPVFDESFGITILKGGSVLYKEEFEMFQFCMRKTGDKYFVLVEDYDEETSLIDAGPSSRFKYPTYISWEEIMSGSELSMDVFLRPIRNFFMFGDGAHWGRYIGNDYDSPLDIIGFDRKFSDLFHSKFEVPKGDIEDLTKWIAAYGMKLPDLE